MMKEQLLSTLETSKNYTLAVASAMPEAQFGFKPATEVWTFAELMSHIAYGIYWWEENYIRGTESEWNPPVAASDKTEALARIHRNSMGYTPRWIILRIIGGRQLPTCDAAG